MNGRMYPPTCQPKQQQITSQKKLINLKNKANEAEH